MDAHSLDNLRSVDCVRSGSSCHCRVTAVLASFNRKRSTLECLARLEQAALHAGVELDAILVDDGSRDGTEAAVRDQFSWVEVVTGDGSLYWSRSMHCGQTHAMKGNAHYLLWLNDDTEIFPDALARLLNAEVSLRKKHGQPVMVVGSMADGQTGRLTYGGYVALQRWKPFSYRRVWDMSEPVECHVMNGNLVLIPMHIARIVGNLDPLFEHAMGDTDYALRARAQGFRVFVAPGFVGNCSHNTTSGTYLDKTLPLSVRWNKMMSRKGLPPQSWRHLTRKHGGVAWPVYFLWPYLKFIVGEIGRLKPGALR